MSKDFNTGWVRARGGLAGLQGKLQADTGGGKTARRIPKLYSWGLTNIWDTKERFSSKSQSSHTGLERQRKEGSAERAWGGSLSENPRDQALSLPHVPHTKDVQHLGWLQIPADSTNWDYLAYTEVRAIYEKQDARITSPVAGIMDKSKQFLLSKRENSLPATEPARTRCCHRAGQEAAVSSSV